MDDDDAAARTGPSTARWSHAAIFVVWSMAIVAPILVLFFAGRRWSLVASGVGLALGIVFTCRYLSTGPDDDEPPVPGQRHHRANGPGLSQGDIEAIPAFEYRTEAKEAGGGSGSGPSSSAAAEECAVCISVLGDGETVRRLPACGHAFHARCINGWLRGHATCPICRAGVKVAAGDGEAAAV